MILRITFSLLNFLYLFGFINGFTVYWNVPTHMCNSHGITFDLAKYNITQNDQDLFNGNRVTIFYRPGRFPYYDANQNPIYGGIPQKANITDHIDSFKSKVESMMPSDFEGAAVLDFEDYYPSYGMSSALYQNAAKDWVKEQHPTWSEDQVKAYATQSFNDSSKLLFQSLLEEGKKLRPKALWGYYHYPYCHNYGPDHSGYCKPEVMDHNDDMAYLYESSTGLYPSIYIFKNGGFDYYTRSLNTRTRLEEALRIRNTFNLTNPILPYFWYRYHDEDVYLTLVDLCTTIGQSRIMNLDGIVIWGSSADVQNTEKCTALKDYVDTYLGPLVKYMVNLQDEKLKYLQKNPEAIPWYNIVMNDRKFSDNDVYP